MVLHHLFLEVSKRPEDISGNGSVNDSLLITGVNVDIFPRSSVNDDSWVGQAVPSDCLCCRYKVAVSC